MTIFINYYTIKDANCGKNGPERKQEVCAAVFVGAIAHV
jgi:hypothetical protein